VLLLFEYWVASSRPVIIIIIIIIIIIDDYGLDDQGSISGRHRFFSFPSHPDRLRGPPSPLCSGYRRHLPRDKADRREADRLFPSIAEDKNAWSSASTVPYVFMTWWWSTVATSPLPLGCCCCYCLLLRSVGTGWLNCPYRCLMCKWLG
jgi:hypothetical protein